MASSITFLAVASGEAFLLILALIIIIILAICLIKIYARKCKHSESTYDKLWVHTSQNSNRNKFKGAKRRDNKHNAFTLSSQQTRTYETVQDIDDVVLQTFTFEKEEDAEKTKEGAIKSNHTSIVIETELVGNEEGLYDVTGQVSMKKNSTIEEAGNCSGVIKPTTLNTETEKLDVHSTEEMRLEVESNNSEEIETESADEETESVDEEIESAYEGTVIQTHQRDVVAQSGEYSQITMSHGIKKPMNTEEIYDVVMVPPATSDGLIPTEKEDTGNSSGYEEGSNGSLSKSTIPQTQCLPMPEDVKVSSCNQKKAIHSTEKQSVDEKTTTKSPQKGMQVVAKCDENAMVAMNQKAKAVEEIYDVIVNQLAAKKTSSPTPPHVEPYAMCTLPALSVTPGNQCAVGKDLLAAADEGYKHSKAASK